MAIIPNPNVVVGWKTVVTPTMAQQVIDAARSLVNLGLFTQPIKEELRLRGGPFESRGTISAVAADLNQIDPSTITSALLILTEQPTPGKPGRSIRLDVNFATGVTELRAPGIDPAQLRASIERHLPREAPPELPQRTTNPTPRQSQQPLATNNTIDAYTLRRRLGSGFSSEVWEATVSNQPPVATLKPGQDVALKCYLPHVLRERIESLRIQREFEVASRIEHENIVRVYDLVMSPSRGYSFIAMNLVRGATLKSRTPRNGMTLKDICLIGQQIFLALAEIHSHRALHRDVKPANIMVTSEPTEPPRIVLLDLGIVSLASDPSMTNTSTFLGSKHTAPLEQLTGDELDARTDIYAAGATLYQCYSGKPMYFKDGPEGGIVARMLRNPEKLVPREPGTPADEVVVQFINTCIQTEPAKRFDDAAGCARALAAIAEQLG